MKKFFVRLFEPRNIKLIRSLERKTISTLKESEILIKNLNKIIEVVPEKEKEKFNKTLAFQLIIHNKLLTNAEEYRRCLNTYESSLRPLTESEISDIHEKLKLLLENEKK